MLSASLLLASLVLAQGAPKIGPGRRWAWGSPQSSANLEIFVDLQCPYSAKAWPQLMQALSRFPETSFFVIPHMFVIAHHHQSWDLATALDIVARENPVQAKQFATHVFSTNPYWENAAWLNRSRADLIHTLRGLAESHGVSGSTFDMEWAAGNASTTVDVEWQFCIRRNIGVTPTFMMNGVVLDGVSSSTTSSQWIDILSQYLP